MKLEIVGQALYSYFSEHNLFKVLLPLSVVIMLICGVLNVLGSFISLGGAVNAVIDISLIVALLLVFSQSNYRMLAIGLALEAFPYLWTVLRSLFAFHYLAWYALIYLLVYGALAFLAYKKSITFNA